MPMKRDALTAAINDMVANKDKTYVVVFKRRSDKVVGGKITQPAGSLRTMTCSLVPPPGAMRGKERSDNDPAKRVAQDARNFVLTVWEHSTAPETKSGFKCIPLDSIESIVAS